MTILSKPHISAIRTAFIATISLIASVSCSVIYDDLPECTSGAQLRFVYDYNMEYANAFHNQVECLTVYFYDAATGHHVATRTVGADQLSDEAYRMTVDLPAGDYKAVAYGGIACADASFAHPAGTPEDGHHFTELAMQLKSEHLSSTIDRPLHNLFYGTVNFSVAETLGTYTAATVEMIRDTNNLRIMFQHINGTPVDPDQFNWTIVGDNTLMAHDNALKAAGKVTYHPWALGTFTGGYMDDGSPITNAYAEFSISRLVRPAASTKAPVSGNGNISRADSPRLIVTRVKDGGTVLSLPLTDILLAYRSDLHADMAEQEYLDRENYWPMLFILNSNDVWTSAEIIINDWTVRINDIENLQ